MTQTSIKTKAGTTLPLISLKGKDYLQVAHRLVWFREEKPDFRIETEFVTLIESHALAKATIRDQHGNIIATAHKREDAKHFPDFIEKSETGAIGRALALIGYGTQFAPELDEEDRIVDSPLERKAVKPTPQAVKPAQAKPIQQAKQPTQAKKPAPVVSLVNVPDDQAAEYIPAIGILAGVKLRERTDEELKNYLRDFAAHSAKNKRTLEEYPEAQQTNVRMVEGELVRRERLAASAQGGG